MSRMMRWMAVPVVLIVAAIWLSSRVAEQPLKQTEKVVSIDALTK
jgi:hypothetical protein